MGVWSKGLAASKTNHQTKSRGTRPAAFVRLGGAKLGGKVREDGIAHAMLQALREELATRPGTKVRRLLVKVGELTDVDPRDLERSFETLTSGTEMASLDVEIEPCPRKHRCRQCGLEFTVIGEEYHCPSCRSRQTSRVGGAELELSFVDTEDLWSAILITC